MIMRLPNEVAPRRSWDVRDIGLKAETMLKLWVMPRARILVAAVSHSRGNAAPRRARGMTYTSKSQALLGGR